MTNNSTSRATMSVEDAKAYLKETLANNTGKNEAKYPANTIRISKAFVFAFAELVNKEERTWIYNNLRAATDKAEETKEPGQIRNPFASFRNEFAARYFPEWQKVKEPKAKKLTFLEKLEALANED